VNFSWIKLFWKTRQKLYLSWWIFKCFRSWIKYLKQFSWQSPKWKEKEWFYFQNNWERIVLPLRSTQFKGTSKDKKNLLIFSFYKIQLNIFEEIPIFIFDKGGVLNPPFFFVDHSNSTFSLHKSKRKRWKDSRTTSFFSKIIHKGILDNL